MTIPHLQPQSFVYKPSWVANTFIWKATEERVSDVDPLKIQKLVYCMHGWRLATAGVPAVGENFEAWPNGPVLANLYHKFKHYRWNTINEYATDVDPSTGEVKALMVPHSDEQFFAVFDRVWAKYKGLTGKQLSDLTHQPGTPWSLARERGQQYIYNDDIQRHFVELATKNV